MRAPSMQPPETHQCPNFALATILLGLTVADMSAAQNIEAPAEVEFTVRFEHSGTHEAPEDILNQASASLRYPSGGQELRLDTDLTDVWEFDEIDDWERGTYLNNAVTYRLSETGPSLSTLLSLSRFEERSEDTVDYGTAFITTATARPFDVRGTRVTPFVEYGLADDRYVDVDELLDVFDDDSPFPDSGFERIRVGTILEVGPFSLSLAGVSERGVQGDDNGEHRRGYDADLSLELTGIEGPAARVGNAPLVGLLPQFLYIELEERSIEPAETSSSSDNRSYNVSWGARWDRDTLGAYAEFYRYDIDDRQPGDAGTDQTGNGIDVGVGYYPGRWSFYSYFTGDYEDLSGGTSFSGSDYSAGVSVGYSLVSLPDLGIGYEYDRFMQRSDGDRLESRDETFFVAFGLTKYVRQPDGYELELSVSLQLVHERDESQFGGALESSSDRSLQVGFDFELLPL